MQEAKAATTTIPVVFESGGGNPVQAGLVASINRPGGNITGISIAQTAVLAKRFELLHQLVPRAETIGVLFNPGYPDAELQIREVQDAAASIKCKIAVASARTEDDLDAAFVTSFNMARVRYSSSTIHISAAFVDKSSRSPRATLYRQRIFLAIFQPRAD